MALVACPDCGHSVSDEARACPSCGRLRQPRTIEQKAQFWKGLQVLCAITAMVSAGIMVVSCDQVRLRPPSLGSLIALVGGILGYVIGGLGVWWYNR